MHKLESRNDLRCDFFHVHLTQSSLAEVHSEISERGVLLGKNVVFPRLKSDVIRIQNMRMRAQVIVIMKFAKKFEFGCSFFVDGFQNDFVAGSFVLNQQQSPSPSLLHHVNYVVFIIQIDLKTKRR